MSCFMCKGAVADKLAPFMVNIEKCIIIVKDVPSQICQQCGEISYSNDVARRLEQILDKMQSSITEIAVTNYSINAA